MINPAAQYCSISHTSSPVLCRNKIRLEKQEEQKKKKTRALKRSQMRGVAGRPGRRW